MPLKASSRPALAFGSQQPRRLTLLCAIRSPLACNRKPTTTTRGTIRMKALAFALTLLWASTAAAQWRIHNHTDSFSGEFTRFAASTPTETQGGAWYTTEGGFTVSCRKREASVRLWFDSIVFPHGRTLQFKTNADGAIRSWYGGYGNDAIRLYGRYAQKFAKNVLAKASSLKVLTWNSDWQRIVLDINMEGAERAIERAFIGC